MSDKRACPVCYRNIDLHATRCPHCARAILTRQCPTCYRYMDSRATRCPHCTSSVVPMMTPDQYQAQVRQNKKIEQEEQERVAYKRKKDDLIYKLRTEHHHTYVREKHRGKYQAPPLSYFEKEAEKILNPSLWNRLFG